jgi:hypothetical protein
MAIRSRQCCRYNSEIVDFGIAFTRNGGPPFWWIVALLLLSNITCAMHARESQCISRLVLLCTGTCVDISISYFVDSLFYDSGSWSGFSSESDGEDGRMASQRDPMQSWDGVDGSLSLFDDKALSSLPFGDVEAEEAAAAASEGLPTYRGSSGSDQGNVRGMSPSLPTTRSLKKPGIQTPEEAAMEEFLMAQAVDEGMKLHHARLEAAHNRYSVASAFGELLQSVEQDDVWRNAEPLLPGTDVRIPTWIRASEAIMPLMEGLNEKTREFEIEQSERILQDGEEQILEEVEAARRLLSLTDPKAGLSVDTGPTEEDALDAFFGDPETLLPGTAEILDGEEGELRRLTQGQENSVMNSLLEEILPEISGYALDYADLAGDGAGSPGMLSGALQALTEEVDTVLEEDGPLKSSDDESDVEEEKEEEEEEEEEED